MPIYGSSMPVTSNCPTTVNTLFYSKNVWRTPSVILGIRHIWNAGHAGYKHFATLAITSDNHVYVTNTIWIDLIFSVPSKLNKSLTVSPAKHPHTITPLPPCFPVGTPHAELIRSPTLSIIKIWRWEPKRSKLDSRQRTDFDPSNVHCSCFLAQASLFLLLVSF